MVSSATSGVGTRECLFHGEPCLSIIGATGLTSSSRRSCNHHRQIPQATRSISWPGIHHDAQVSRLRCRSLISGASSLIFCELKSSSLKPILMLQRTVPSFSIFFIPIQSSRMLDSVFVDKLGHCSVCYKCTLRKDQISDSSPSGGINHNPALYQYGTSL
jgi:hypothetical protein